MTSPLPDAALAYARRGISVFPLVPRSKAPIVKNGFLQATTDLDQVRRWWRKTPTANIGIATGAPAGFWVLDVDGEAAESALAALEAQHGLLPVTVQQQTGRGRHVCFRWDPQGVEMRNRSKVGGADIDVRGNGGYIVAPPSIHPGDEKKGVPPGRVYAWSWGRAPEDLDFAEAPAWLVEICKPRDQVTAAPARVEGPRPAAGGRASRYGEVVLDGCVRAIVTAQKGTRDSTLYRFACKAAGLVPTGHVELAYLRETLLHAGAAHVPDAMTQAQLERQIDRAIQWGADHGWGPDPERRTPRSAARPAAEAMASPVQQAVARAEGLAFLDDAPPISGRVFREWCDLNGFALPGRMGVGLRLRLVENGRRRALALPLQQGPDAPADGAALFGLGGGGACLGLRGLSAGRVAVLAWPAGCDQLLVTTHLADAFALGEAAFDSGDPMAVVVAPRLSTFAGGPLGDRWGRVNTATPQADPARPPWTWPGMATVYLAVRRDLEGPELKVRKALGGTKTARLQGDAAARFWGGLASAGWRRALSGSGGAANAVRVMSPPAGRMGFSELGAE